MYYKYLVSVYVLSLKFLNGVFGQTENFNCGDVQGIIYLNG